MSITYDGTHERLDLDQIEILFRSAGWDNRVADRERLRRMIDGSRWVVSAWDGEHLVGFCRAISDGAFNAYVSTVAVLPDYRRQGIGRELMRRLLADRDEILFVLRAEPENHRFYQQFGFHVADNMLRRARRG